MTKKHSIPKVASLDEAFAQIENIHNEYPVDAIEFLYNHPADERIVEKIIFHIENYFNNDIMYDKSSGIYSNAGIFYAVVAENHLDMRYVVPIAKIFEVETDGDVFHEQVCYLVGALCEKYGDAAVSIFISAMEEYSKKNRKTAYLYLIDALHYADMDRYKNRILAFLKPDEHWIEPFVSMVSHLQIKEAIPIIKELIVEEEIKAKHGERSYYDMKLNEFSYALEELETTNKKFSNYSPVWYEERGKGWKKYLGNFFGKANNIIPKKVGRNDPCFCGSGKKYKKCCMS